MKHCPKANTPTAIGVNAQTHGMVASKTGCGQWNCPYCATIRKYFVARKCYLGIKHYQETGSPNWFFGTVTMHENWRGWASIVNYKKNWNKFYQRMLRVTDGPLLYCILPEHHKDGSLHIHLLSTCQEGDRWFKDNGRECGFGYKNENGALDDTNQAVWYVTKYISKSLAVGDWPKNFRRIRFSINWPEPPKRDDYVWSSTKATDASLYIRRLFEAGYNPLNWITKEQVSYEPYLRQN